MYPIWFTLVFVHQGSLSPILQGYGVVQGNFPCGFLRFPNIPLETLHSSHLLATLGPICCEAYEKSPWHFVFGSNDDISQEDINWVVATQILFIFTPNLGGRFSPILTVTYFSKGMVQHTKTCRFCMFFCWDFFVGVCPGVFSSLQMSRPGGGHSFELWKLADQNISIHRLDLLGVFTISSSKFYSLLKIFRTGWIISLFFGDSNIWIAMVIWEMQWRYTVQTAGPSAAKLQVCMDAAHNEFW